MIEAYRARLLARNAELFGPESPPIAPKGSADGVIQSWGSKSPSLWEWALWAWEFESLQGLQSRHPGPDLFSWTPEQSG